MSTTEVTYYLPKSVIRLSATVKTTTDELSSDPIAPETSDWKAELLTVADNNRGRTVTLGTSWLFDYGIKLAMSEDGRMTSASLDSTGQLGTVLASAAGLAVSIASAATFGLPGVLSRLVPGAGEAITREDLDGSTEEPGDPVAHRYHEEHPEEFRRLTELKAEYTEAQDAVTAARRAHRKAAAATRDQAWRDYRQLIKAANDVSSELDRAKLMFTTWRASKQKTTEVVHECRLAVADLPVLEHESLTLDYRMKEGADPAEKFYAEVGYLVCLTERPPGGGMIPAGATTSDARLSVVQPRAVTLVTVRKGTDGNPQVTGYQRVLVVDEHCSEVSVPIRKSLFARRNTAVTLSELGALVGLELGGTSSAAGAAAAATGVRTEALAALESAEKARKSLDTLSAADAEAELAGLKRELAIEEQRLLLAGQAATASDYARLQWLKQQVDIKEARAKLGGPIPL
jgi:hypothetical protein